MAVSKSSIQVPADLFLKLARLYKEQPQDYSNPGEFLVVHLLEQRAYRKVKHGR